MQGSDESYQTLQDIKSLLSNIYDRLEHVKVDSFVNIRVMDEFGAAPVPCTEATGLLVSAFAGDAPLPVLVKNPTTDPVNATLVGGSGGSLDVNVTNSDLPVSISGTVSTSVTNVPHVIVNSGSIGISSGSVSIAGIPVVRPQVKDAWSGTWADLLGFKPARSSYYRNGSEFDGTQTGAALLATTALPQQDATVDTLSLPNSFVRAIGEVDPTSAYVIGATNYPPP